MRRRKERSLARVTPGKIEAADFISSCRVHTAGTVDVADREVARW